MKLTDTNGFQTLSEQMKRKNKGLKVMCCNKILTIIIIASLKSAALSNCAIITSSFIQKKRDDRPHRRERQL